MSNDLDWILGRIDPARTVDETYARVDDAINACVARAAVVTDRAEFRTRVMAFMGDVEARVLGVSAMPDSPADFAWGRCVEVLSDVYGRSGEPGAFEIARSGNEGGMYSVLRTIGHRVADRYVNRELEARVTSWWCALTSDQKLAAAAAYLDRFGDLLPSELLEGGAARLKANFPKLLQQHPWLVQRLRRIGR